MKREEIKNLLALLDDPDPLVFDMVEKKLLDIGLPVIDQLEEFWSGSLNHLLHQRIEDIIHRIQFAYVKNGLSKWSSEGGGDLLEGAFWVARYQFPDLQFSEIESAIEDIQKDVWLELIPNLTALEKIKVLNHIFFETHKFSMNITNFYAARNSFINQVIELKKGSPITLGILYSAVAQRLNIPVHGVDLPKTFILAYVDENQYLKFFEQETLDTVLFYINPVSRGTVFGKKEIEFYLKQQKIDPKPSYFLPCPNQLVIKKLISSLIKSFQHQADELKVKELTELLKLVD